MNTALPLARSWLATETRISRDPRRPPALAAAVAAIVAVAAERARAAGDLGALRDAIESALDAIAPPGGDPRDADAADLPRIADMDPAREAAALSALLGRLRAG
jgi:hypothetical protein